MEDDANPNGEQSFEPVEEPENPVPADDGTPPEPHQEESKPAAPESNSDGVSEIAAAIPAEAGLPAIGDNKPQAAAQEQENSDSHQGEGTDWKKVIRLLERIQTSQAAMAEDQGAADEALRRIEKLESNQERIERLIKNERL